MTSPADIAAPNFSWIDQPSQLAEVAKTLAAAPWLAVDTESNSMFVYRERMCLLQINAGDTLFVIDALALAMAAGDSASAALAPLKKALEATHRPLWVHGGEYDVGVFRRDFGIVLGGVWDSQQAASMLGWERTGYGAVVEKVCGVFLDKAYTQYDWGTRPLDPGALRYAVDDVVYLPKIAEELRTLIAAADLDEELAIANAAVAEAGWSGGYDPSGFWKIKGVRELQSHSQGVLAALYAWRDGIAKIADKPPGRIINNETLLYLARTVPTTFQLLKRSGVKTWLLTEQGEVLLKVIKDARSDTRPLPPRPRHREVAPEEELRETRLKDWRRSEAENRKVPLQVVLPARALENLKQFGTKDLNDVPQLGKKRMALYGWKLRELCDVTVPVEPTGETTP